MKFLGLELTGVAGYDKQFVAINDGINLIVGRNNIGKTAMLSATTVLGHLPVGRQSAEKMPGSALEYASGGFDVSLHFQADGAPIPLIDDRPAVQQQLSDGETRFVYNFRVSPEGWVLLRDVLAHVKGRELAIVRVSNDSRAYVRCRYDSQSGATQGSSSTPLGGLVTQYGVASIYPEDDVFGVLSRFRKLIFVSGHRVFADFQELRTVSTLGSDARDLGPYLQWLQGNAPRKFGAIQAFVTHIFPEFDYINLENVISNQLTIRLTKHNSEQKIQLSKCGTCVEQLLALATFVIASESGTMICLDEPHSFLHPGAERRLVRFLQEHIEHTYLVTTHSAVFINSVPASHITVLSGLGYGFAEHGRAPIAKLLFDLGYRNSDLLFAERLIFVEGESDQEVLPILLRKAGLSGEQLANTAFVKLKGSGDPHTVTRQSEELLSALHKEGIPRIYLFDGDKRPNKEYLQKIKNQKTGRAIPVAFLGRKELENYLLDAHAIAAAINQETAGDAEAANVGPVETKQVQGWLTTAIAACGKEAKGSEIFKHVYERVNRRFKKTEHGRLIAIHTSLETNAVLEELIDPVRPVFEREGATDSESC